MADARPHARRTGERLAVETLADVLPGATVIEVLGEFSEDWLRTLRIRRVLSADGNVLFEVDEGHDDPRVEAAIDGGEHRVPRSPARPHTRHLHGRFCDRVAVGASASWAVVC